LLLLRFFGLLELSSSLVSTIDDDTSSVLDSGLTAADWMFVVVVVVVVVLE
jgi:hypothetical protein